MRNCIKLIKADCMKQIFCKTFLACILGVALLEILDTLPNLLQTSWRDDEGILRFTNTVINMLETGGFTMFQLMALSICVLSASCSYCVDEESGTINEILIRSSHRKYTAASMISCAVTAFLCMVLGEIIMTVFYGRILPVHWEEKEVYEQAYPLLRTGHYFLYIAAVIILRGLKGAFFAMAAFMLSGFVRNKFAIVAVPVLIFYFLERFGYGYLGVSFDKVNVHNVYYFFSQKTEALSLFYSFSYTVLAGIVFAIVFYNKMRRKC